MVRKMFCTSCFGNKVPEVLSPIRISINQLETPKSYGAFTCWYVKHACSSSHISIYIDCKNKVVILAKYLVTTV